MPPVKHKSPLVPIVDLEGKIVYVHPVDAMEITINGLGKYLNIDQAPPKVKEELKRIEKQVAFAITPSKQSQLDNPLVKVAEGAKLVNGEELILKEEEGSTEEDTFAAPKLKRRQATAGIREG